MKQSYLIHYDEICLKKGNRKNFENILVRNLKNAFHPLGVNRVFAKRNRIWLETEDIDREIGISVLSKVSGICDFSPAEILESDPELLSAKAVELARELPEGSFKVEVHRSDKSYPIESPELSRIIGVAIVEDSNRKVSLKNPDHKIHLQVYMKESYLFAIKYPGLGGLPVGSSGRLLCFLSGGIDSPVAAFRMFPRGCKVSFVHFHNQHEDSSDVKDKVVQLTQILSHYQPYSRLYMVPFGELQRALIGYSPSKLRMVAYRRMMLRIASLIRGREKAAAYVTGDSVGQVASQTLTNLHAIHAIADAPILSPLIGYSKHEIINEARRIETFETSILPCSDCCSFLVDENPIRESMKENSGSLKRIFL